MKDNTNKIESIKIAEIDDFENHPFRVINDDDMQSLIESIKVNGILTPVIVRKKAGGRYEMISGHRRKYACEKLGIEGIPATVTEMTREQAIIAMVDSNCQRSNILPSEKAFAYKMKYDAIKHQGKATSCPVGAKSRSDDILSENANDSARQIQRYIRLTYLIPELLDYVDEGNIKMRPAVELSYLDREFQEDVAGCIEEYIAFPSHAQAIIIRREYEEDTLSYDRICEIMSEPKPNQKEKLSLPIDELKQFVPYCYSYEEKKAFILKALDFYKRYLIRQRNNER